MYWKLLSSSSLEEWIDVEVPLRLSDTELQDSPRSVDQERTSVAGVVATAGMLAEAVVATAAVVATLDAIALLTLAATVLASAPRVLESATVSEPRAESRLASIACSSESGLMAT
jgi:hypothetical protein